MTKWIVLFLFILSISLFEPALVHARAVHRRPNFHFKFPLPLRYSKPSDPTPTYNRQIYRSKEYQLPRVYTLYKPLVDDPRIYRPLILHGQMYSPSSFYRYDKERRQYSAPKQLHADGKIANLSNFISIEIEGQVYYYDEGFFYQEIGGHLIVVPPVVNSIVQTIPESRKSTEALSSHFAYNGIYYKRVLNGYQVINLPVI